MTQNAPNCGVEGGRARRCHGYSSDMKWSLCGMVQHALHWGASCDAWHAGGGEVGRAEHEKVRGEKRGRGQEQGVKVRRGKSRRRGGGKWAHAWTCLCVHLCVCVEQDEEYGMLDAGANGDRKRGGGVGRVLTERRRFRKLHRARRFYLKWCIWA
jgi:hypothetical protein